MGGVLNLRIGGQTGLDSVQELGSSSKGGKEYSEDDDDKQSYSLNFST